MAKEKVYLIDDDKNIYKMLHPMLPDYNFIPIYSVKDAKERIKKEPYGADLIVLDQQLKDGSGIELLKNIREHNTEVGVIMLTGFGSKELVIQSLDHRADAYLEKPIDFDLLNKKINEILIKTNFSKGTGDAKSNLDQMISLVRENPEKYVSLRSIAEKLGFNEKYLSREFVKMHGVTFTELRLKFKIEKAKKMLIRKDLSVVTIAKSLGYKDPGSFMRIFKQNVGLTPSEYRKINIVE